MSSGEDGRAMSSVTSSDGAGDGADDDRRSHDDKRSSSELPPSASTPTTTAAAAPAGPNPTTVHLTTLGAWSATDSMMGSMPAAAAAAAESTSERDDTDAATIDAVLPGEAVAAVADHVVVSFEGRRPGGGRDAGQSSLPATVVAAGSVEPAPSSPTGQNHGAGGRATSGVSSALKSSPRFSPLAVQLNTIRKVAGRAVSRGGGAGGGAAAGSFSSADRFEAGADSERGANSESDASASASNRTPSFIGGLGMLSGGAATVVSALQKMGSSADNSESGGGTDQQVPSSISARLNVLLLATSSKRSVPPAVRAERAARVQRAVQSSTDSNGEPLADPFPTQLHRVCANPDASLLHLQTELARTPSSASVTDCLGRLPLHVLGDNTGLVSSAVGRATATKFAHQLMRVYPEAITASDAAGFYPFVGLIYDWEQHSYRHADKKQRTGASTMLQPATRLFGRITDVVSQTGTGISNAMEKSYQAAASFVTDPAAGESSARDGISAGAGPGSFSFRNLFPRIAIWDEVEWCFEMLSIEMEELGGKSGGLYPSENDATSEDLNERDLDARLLLAKHLLTKMPSIIKTILLIDSGGDEGTTRKVLLQSPLFRAMLLQKESVGDWLTAMIRKRGMASQFAVDYLSMVSGTTIEDYVGLFRPVLLVDKEEFQYARTAVFQAIDELDGTVASLVTLGEKEIERAVTTTVIWYIMSRNLARPFVVSMSLIDFVLQIILLLAFRVKVSDPDYGYSSGPRIPTNIVYVICWNYFLRKGCQLVALASVSGAVLRNYFLNFGNLTDLLAIILVLVTYGFQEANQGTYRNGLNTFVLGLLWLRILAFMKVVNKEMSTFIMALGQIFRDLLYFMIVLVVVILMFSDTTATFALLTRTANWRGHCEQDFYYSVLRTYAVLIGDFAVDDFTATPGMIILFVIFTMVGVVIFLSVLIAVICDSYEIAKLSSQRLFGKARVSFVAQNEALESFLKPGGKPVFLLNASPSKIVATGIALLRWGVLITLVVTAMYAEVFIVTQAVSSIINQSAYLTVIFMTILAVVLTCALWILVVFAVGGVARAVAPGILGSVVRFLDRITESFSKAMAYRLFGLSKAERTPFPTSVDEEEEEWQGRMAHMEQMVFKTGNRIRDELKAEMLALEKRLYEHEKLAAAERRPSAQGPSPQDPTPNSDGWDSFKIHVLDETEEEG